MLDINGGLLVASAVIFLLVLVILNKWLYKPLIKFMDDRDEAIKRDLENVAKNSGDVDELHRQANDIVSKAKAEAHAIREKAINEAKKLVEAKISSKKEELEKSYSEFAISLEEEKVALKNSLLSQVPLFKESLKAKFSQL